MRISFLTLSFLILSLGLFAPERKSFRIFASTTIVETWTVNAYRWIPFIGKPITLQHRYLPVDANSAIDSKLRPGSTLGVLVRENGGATEAYWTGRLIIIDENIRGLELDFRNLTRVGRYKGTIDLAPEDTETGTVTVTVNATDIVIWPLLGLVFGIYAAVRIQKYIGVDRKILQWLAREAELGQKCDKAQQRFREQAEGKPYATYEICEALKVQRRVIARRLVEIGQSRFPALDEEEDHFKIEIVGPIELIEAAIVQWDSLAGDLKALEEALNNVKAHARNAPPPKPLLDAYSITLIDGMPRFYTQAHKLLEGESIGLDAFNPLRESVNKSTEVAKLWSKQEQAVKTVRRAIEELRTREAEMNESEKRRLDHAQSRINSAWVGLWTAENADDFAKRNTEADIKAAQDALAGLERFFREPTRPTTADPTETRAFPLPRLFEQALKVQPLSFDFLVLDIGLTTLPADDEARAKTVKRMRLRRDRVLLWSAIGIAVTTGLAALYFGKNFGSLMDYLAVITWGMVTKAALETINVAVEGLYSQHAV
jgi:hypothetical protein